MRSIPLLRVAAVLLAIPVPAGAAQRSFTVESFDRIRIDGGYQVNLATGVAPFASAIGSAAALDGLSLEVQGRTLVVHSNPSAWSSDPGAARGAVVINVGTHDLTAAWVNGPGLLVIDGVKGLTFDLSVQGSGGARIGRLDVDQLHLAMAGSTGVKLAGNVLRATVRVQGSSTLDARSLEVKDATLGAEGPATIALAVSDSAKIDASGTGSITLTGHPACTVRVKGSATVEGCP